MNLYQAKINKRLFTKDPYPQYSRNFIADGQQERNQHLAKTTLDLILGDSRVKEHGLSRHTEMSLNTCKKYEKVIKSKNTTIYTTSV